MKGKRTFWCIFVLVLSVLLLASRASSALAAPERSNLPINQAAGAASNACGSWRDMPSPFASGQLFGVAAISHTDVWAVGYEDALFNSPPINTAVIEHWDGTRWSVIQSPQPGNYRTVLEKVVALSSSNVWAVGDYENAKGGFEEPEKTLIEHWDGTGWSVIASPNPNAFTIVLSGITALSANDIWTMGVAVTKQGSSKSLSEHWDGTRWSIVSTPNPGTYGNGLGSVSALSSSDIWSVGSFSNTHLGLSQTLTAHWDGTRWSVIPSPNIGTLGDGLEGVTAISSKDIWASGWYAYHAQDGSEALGTMTDHWDGTHWSVIATPNPPGGDNDLHGVTSLATNEVWAVGTSVGGPIVIEWNGQQWNTAPTPGPAARWLWSVSALSPHDIWSVGSIATDLLIMHYC